MLGETTGEHQGPHVQSRARREKRSCWKEWKKRPAAQSSVRVRSKRGSRTYDVGLNGEREGAGEESEGDEGAHTEREWRGLEDK